jgi:Kef-type K+ transport system membrane component KefB
LLAEVPIGLRVPTVVLEIALGYAVGPHGLNLVQPGGLVASLAELGLTMLFFMAGLELDLKAIRGRPTRLAVGGWVATLALAALAVAVLASLHMVRAPLLVGVALTTTAIGTLLPILRDSGELETPFGTYVLAAGAIGEFGPILVVSVLITGNHTLGVATALVLLFFGVVAVLAWAGVREHPPKLMALAERTFEASSQLPVRSALLLLAALVVLANSFQLDFILGAFAAGMLVRMVAHGSGNRLLQTKMDALSFGFLIPIFFVVTGVKFDLPVLLSAPGALARVPLFVLLLLLARGLPALLFRGALGGRDQLALAFYMATGLPLLVAITEVGLRRGVMLVENAVALVAAGMISVLLFPLLAGMLRRHRPQRRTGVGSDSPEGL